MKLVSAVRQKETAVCAGLLQASSAVLKVCNKYVAKAAPPMVKGYVGTPIGNFVVAQVAAVVLENAPVEKERIGRLQSALLTTAWLELSKTLKIEELLEQILSAPEVKRALVDDEK